MSKISDNKILAYALKNAVEHSGSCVAGSVLSPLFAEGLEKSQVKEIMPKINEIVKKVNAMDLEEQKKELDKLENLLSEREVRDPNELPELPEVDKKKGVIMRFAPAPSGPLHIGHIISNMISSLFVKKYGGKFYIRIEDTNPESIDPEAYTNIKKDCDWLFGNVTEYIIQSDRLDKYYEFAEKLIKNDAAFVCTCKKEAKEEQEEEFPKPRELCDCRKNSIKDNQEKWKKMLDKKGFKEGEAVLRFKSADTNLNNPALIDFPLARINEHKHPRQGKKYRVWPLMNLSVTFDDIDYAMTHVIRGKDHRDNAERQKLIYKSIGLEKKFPWTFFMGRIKFTDLVLSKRKIQAAINEGKFTGFDDPKLPTIASLRKRGYKSEAFAKMATQRGLTEVDKVMPQKDFFDVLDRFNKE